MEPLGGVGEGGDDAQPDDPEDDDDQADDQPCGRRHPSLKGRVGDAEGDGENDDEAGGDDGGEGRGTPQDVEEVDTVLGGDRRVDHDEARRAQGERDEQGSGPRHQAPEPPGGRHDKGESVAAQPLLLLDELGLTGGSRQGNLLRCGGATRLLRLLSGQAVQPTTGAPPGPGQDNRGARQEPSTAIRVTQAVSAFRRPAVRRGSGRGCLRRHLARRRGRRRSTAWSTGSARPGRGTSSGACRSRPAVRSPP